MMQAISLLIAFQAIAAAALGKILFRRQGRPDRREPLDLSQIQTVLVVRLDEIGDMVMFSPFLRSLRRLLPEARITLVVKPGVRNLMEQCPYVDEVLAFDQRGSRALRFLALPLRAFGFARRFLWNRRFDLAILPRWDADYYYAAFVAFWSGAPRRVGYSETTTDYKRQVNRGFDRLLTHALPDQGLKHDVEHNAAMIRFFGGAADDDRQEVWLSDEDHAYAQAALREQGVGPEETLIGIGPSGGHSVLKQWPLEHFIALGRRLQEQHGARLLIVGGPGEEEMGETLARQLGPGTINLVGKTTLRRMAALILQCRVYIGNDSGPTHVAAATGIPVVAIFGSSCPHRFHPGEQTILLWRDLPCGPCRMTGHTLNRCKRCIFDRPRCLTDILPDTVARAVAQCLSAPPCRLPMTAAVEAQFLSTQESSYD